MKRFLSTTLILVFLSGCGNAVDIDTSVPEVTTENFYTQTETEIETSTIPSFPAPSYPTGTQTAADNEVDAVMQSTYTEFYYQDIILTQIPAFLDADEKTALTLLREAQTKFKAEEELYHSYADNYNFNFSQSDRDRFYNLYLLLSYTRTYPINTAIDEIENDDNHGSYNFKLAVDMAYQDFKNK